MSEPAPNTETPAPLSKLRTLIRSPLRLLDWMAENRTNMVIVAGTALLGIIVLVGIFIYKQRELQKWEASRPKPVTLKMALQSLDEGSYIEARKQALELRSKLTSPEQKPACLYILGAVAAHQAEDT